MTSPAEDTSEIPRSRSWGLGQAIIDAEGDVVAGVLLDFLRHVLTGPDESFPRLGRNGCYSLALTREALSQASGLSVKQLRRALLRLQRLERVIVWRAKVNRDVRRGPAVTRIRLGRSSDVRPY